VSKCLSKKGPYSDRWACLALLWTHSQRRATCSCLASPVKGSVGFFIVDLRLSEGPSD
jgi:hypothetical protein